MGTLAVASVAGLIAVAEGLAGALIRIYDMIQQIAGDQEIPSLGDIIQKGAGELTDIQIDKEQIQDWLRTHPK